MFEINVESVPEFLRAILPTEPHFPEGHWIFRGQGDARWGLIPSIRRETPWEKIGELARLGLRAEGGVIVSSEAELKKPERALLDILSRAVDRLGLPSELKEENALLAFAQHIGLPTRLLDCTDSPMAAAYFAAADAVQMHGQGRLVVYAVSTAYVQHSGRLDHVDSLRVPGYGNVNLVVQNGVLLKINDGPYDLLHGLERRAIAAGAPLSNEDAAAIDGHLFAITLSWENAPALLRALRAQGVHAGTLFPGNAGVAELVRETMRTEES